MIVVDPYAWAALRKFKTLDNSNESLIGAGTVDAVPMLLGLPVLVNRFAPPFSGVIVDRLAIVSAVSVVSVNVSTDFYFDSNSVGLLATWRTGSACVRPDRIAKFTVIDGGS